MNLQNFWNQYLHDGKYLSAILLVVITLLYTIRKSKSYSGIPPGPWGIPVFGYLPFLGKEPCKQFNKLAKTYGDLFSIQLGSRLVIVLNNHDLIRKAFKLEAYDGRPTTGLERGIFGNGIITSDGEVWRKQRRFLLSAMRDFGLGKSQMEEFIQNEVVIAEEVLNANKEKPYDISIINANIACNVIAFFIFGQRFSLGNEGLKKAINGLSKLIESVNFLDTFNSFPKIIEYLPGKLISWDRLLSLKNTNDRFIDDIIHEHKKTFNANDIRDIIDVYLKKLHQNDNKENNLHNDDLRSNVQHLFMAGIHTTSNSMSWMFRILAAHPNVQKQMQDELDSVVGRERLPMMKDRQYLPYTEAVFLELHRYISLIPLTLYHRVTETITFEGYQIPKDACALANIWNVHHSEGVWKEPDKFNPQRFLDKNGKLIPQVAENVLSFSTGRRSCIGEPIARMEIFLVVTSLCHKFHFKLPRGEVWKFQPDCCITSTTCHKYLVCASPRT